MSERPHQVEENIYTVNACGPEPPRRPESLHVGAAIAASSLTVLVPVPQLSANSLPSTEQEYCEAQPVVTRQASQVHGQYDIAEPVLMPRIHINDPQADRGYCLAQPVAELTPPELPEKSYANLKVSTRRPRPPIPSIRRQVELIMHSKILPANCRGTGSDTKDKIVCMLGSDHERLEGIPGIEGGLYTTNFHMTLRLILFFCIL